MDAVHEWLRRFIVFVDPADCALLALWAAHTHFHEQIGTTPRLALTSPLPEAGKTTCLEHLYRLAYNPVQMGSVTSPAMLSRLLDAGMRTLLVDEVDRNLHPEREGVGELLAVLNSGYKRGATRPTSVPDGQGGWSVRELPTFAPVAMAGISPHLPDDTASRTLTVLLLPDPEGTAEDSDWELIEDDCLALAGRLSEWAASTVLPRPEMPPGVRGRAKERWRPLWRVAHAAGGDWPERCEQLIVREAEQLAYDREDGIMHTHPAVALLRDIADAWPPGADAWRTPDMARTLASLHPERWGVSTLFPKGLTEQRIGVYLSKNFGLRTVKVNGARAGYSRKQIAHLAARLHLHPLPDETVQTVRSVPTVPAERDPTGDAVALLAGTLGATPDQSRQRTRQTRKGTA